MFRLVHQIAHSKLIGVTLILVFLSVLSVSLFHMSAGMDMVGNTSGCLFMLHGETLCTMSLSDHIGEWKSVFLTAIPGLILLLGFFVAAGMLLTVAPHLLIKQPYRPPLLSRNFIECIYSFSYRYLQELLSSGILHPKLF